MIRKTKNTDGPLMIRTACADISTKFSTIESSADSYLLIPFNNLELKAIIRNLIGIKSNLRDHCVPFNLTKIDDRTDPGLDDQLIRKILSLMDANLDNDQFGIAELCYALGMSRAQIYRKFKSHTDRTLHNYLRAYRLQKAKEFLLTTNLNVSEIAYRAGFKNVSHFSRIFTKEFGISPSEFGRI